LSALLALAQPKRVPQNYSEICQIILRYSQERVQEEVKCCDKALYFFYKDELFKQGLSFYSKFFGLNGRPSAGTKGALIEKTPKYSDDPVVPHRIYQLLAQQITLVFILRQPEEALISLCVRSQTLSSLN
jgi:hypothetical protein